MLTQLSTVKSRLGLSDAEVGFDPLLTNAIEAVSRRFDLACSRTLARSVDALQEFNATDTELCLACYPVESVGKFELKSSEAGGWGERAGVEFLLWRQCVLSLAAPLGSARQLARVSYTGGYVLPGAVPGPGQTALPADLEQAAVEQVVFWFQTRDQVGVIREWPKGGTYEQFADLDLLPSVRTVLAGYTRMSF
jgi:hypothetical protein